MGASTSSELGIWLLKFGLFWPFFTSPIFQERNFGLPSARVRYLRSRGWERSLANPGIQGLRRSDWPIIGVVYGSSTKVDNQGMIA